MKNEKEKNIIIIILSIVVGALAVTLFLVSNGTIELNDIVKKEILTSSDNCINNDSICENGTLVNVKVNDEEAYDFYVINDDGKELTLIMDRNLGDNVAWYAGATDNSYGPKTAVSALKKRTEGWTNIEEKEYSFSDDGEEHSYTSFTEKMRARMLTYKEATLLGCIYQHGKCPSWLYINLSYTGLNTDDNENHVDGYWITEANAQLPSHVVRQSSNALYVKYFGYISDINVNHNSYGIRPVITLSKNI